MKNQQLEGFFPIEFETKKKTGRSRRRCTISNRILGRLSKSRSPFSSQLCYSLSVGYFGIGYMDWSMCECGSIGLLAATFLGKALPRRAGITYLPLSFKKYVQQVLGTRGRRGHPNLSPMQCIRRGPWVTGGNINVRSQVPMDTV